MGIVATLIPMCLPGGQWAAPSLWVAAALPLTPSPARRYTVMQRCWAADPAARPTFRALAGEVEQVAAALQGDHYVQLSAAYVNLGLAAASEEPSAPPELPVSPRGHRSPSRPRPLSEPPRPT